MEMTSHSLSHAKASSLSPPFFPANTTLLVRSSVNFLGCNCLPKKLKFSPRELRKFCAIRASDSESSAATEGSNVVTVGRVRDKADVVIPVPTVSGMHARIEKTEESLLITDLESTNGTYINEKRLIPGLVSPASPGNIITFGDTNLAIFRIYKLELEESGVGSETEPT